MKKPSWFPRRALLVAALISGVLACGPRAGRSPGTPADSSTASTAPAEPLALRLLPAPEGVAPAPEGCNTHLAIAVPECDATGEATARLDQALQIANELDRDRALAQQERCPAFPPGAIRALRAELGPSQCADLLVDDYFAKNTQPPRADLKDLLFGLGIAARLERVRFAPPAAADATQSKDKFLEYFKAQLAPWIVQQAKAIHELMEQAVQLRGYGRGIAAIAAGIADLRFVELTRSLPLPKEMTDDAALRDAYYGTLDQALEPRKQRGRDAALVGLKELASVGVLHSARLEQARLLLSSQYSGRRVDLLDDLLLPAPSGSAAVEQGTVNLLVRLPSYYVADLAGPVDATKAEVLRGLLEQGLPRTLSTELKSAALSAEGREHYARLLFELGRKYWRAADFKEAGQVALFYAPGKSQLSEQSRLLGALAQALQAGPESAAEMMIKGPLLQGTPELGALDVLVKEKGPFAGLAAYDAALLQSLNPPSEKPREFWQQVEKRYRNAATLLKDPAQRKEAQARATAAAQTAAAAR